MQDEIKSSLFDGQATPPSEVAPTEIAIVETPTPPIEPTPPVESVVTPIEAVTPTPTFSEMFEGKFSTADEVKAELSKYQQLVKDLESKEPDFANDDIRYINHAMKAGFDESSAKVLKKVQDGTLTDPKDIVAAKLQIQLGWSKEKIEGYMDRTYKLGDDHDVDDADVQAARDQLEMQSVIDKTFLAEQAAKITVPQKVDYNTLIQDQLKTWEPILPNIVKDNAVIKLSDEIAYNVPAETLATVQKYVQDVLGLEPGYDPKTHSNEVSELVNKEIWWREKSNIAKHIENEYAKKAIREKSVVPPPSGDAVPPSGNQEVDQLKNLLGQMAKENGQTYR
jgi:hypothetical protein